VSPIREAIAQGWNVRVPPLAREAGTCAATIYNGIKRGEIRAIWIGPNTVRVPADEARRLLGLDKPEAA
jgi:hypothetical protein